MRHDRRRHARFELTEGTVGVLTARGKSLMRVGSITDISEGGAAFRYDHRTDLPENSLRLHLFGPKNSHLTTPGLPCRIVFEGFPTSTSSSTPKGFCSIAFDNLSHCEMVTLREFIARLKSAPSSQIRPEQPTCSIDVPIGSNERGYERKRNERLAPPKQMPQILVVDDEAMIVTLTCRILEKHGYRVTAKTCPEEALDVFRSNPGEVDLIITDYQMPLMTGAEFAREVLHTRPDVPIILYSGYSEVMTDQMAGDLGFRCLAVKPLHREDLIKLVRSVLDGDKPDVRVGTICGLSDPLQGIEPQGAHSNSP